MSLKYITHQSKEILIVSFRDCSNTEEMIALATKLKAEVQNSPGNLRILSDYEGVMLNAEYMSKVKEMGKEVQGKVTKSAVIGVGGVKKILLNAYNRYTRRNMVAFDSYDQAMSYLAKD